MTAGSDREGVRKSTIVLIGAAAGPWVDYRTTGVECEDAPKGSDDDM